jgi:hypothetical protein
MDGERKLSAIQLGKSLISGKSRCRWTTGNPVESTGEQYHNLNLGRYQCWEAMGEARHLFEEIAPQIKAHLEKSSDPLSHPVIWTIYMIGRTREDSVPTIMFCATDKRARNEIKQTIRSSGILDKYPGIQTGSCTEEFRHFAGWDGVDDWSETNYLGLGKALAPNLEEQLALSHEGPFNPGAGQDENDNPSAADLDEFIPNQLPSSQYASDELRPAWSIPLEVSSTVGSISDSCSSSTIIGVESDPSDVFQSFKSMPAPLPYPYIDIRPSMSRYSTPLNHNFRSASTFHTEYSHPTERSSGSDALHLGTRLAAHQAVLYLPPDVSKGIKLQFQGFPGNPFTFRTATVGGVIRHQSLYFAITVAHALDGSDTYTRTKANERIPFEFELDDDYKDTEDIEIRSTGSASPESRDLGSSTTSLTRTSSASSEATEESVTPSSASGMIRGSGFQEHKSANSSMTAVATSSSNSKDELRSLGDYLISSTSGPRPTLDYCLVEINQSEIHKLFKVEERPLARSIARNGPRDVNVMAMTGFGGNLKGRLSGTPSFLMLPGSNSAQEVWSVRHNGELVSGDCGAWVVDAAGNGELFGHIVGGSPDLGVAYIIPACYVFDDLQERFAGDWSLPKLLPADVSLTDHSWTPQITASYRCTLCSKDFERDADLKRHEARSLCSIRNPRSRKMGGFLKKLSTLVSTSSTLVPTRVPSIPPLVLSNEPHLLSRQKVSPEELRDLHELIKQRYELDVWIWSHRKCYPADRWKVRKEMDRADEILARITNLMHLWDTADVWETMEDWRKLRDVKRRLEEGGKREWASHPPWEEVGE